MEEKKLNPAESLELITSMIRNTQSKLERSAGTPMIVLGYTTLFTSILIWGLFNIGGIKCGYIHFLWFIIPLIGWPLAMFITKKSREQVKIKNHFDTIIGYIWAVLGFGMLSISISAFFIPVPILFIILILMCIGVIITGIITEVKILIINGIIGFILSFLCLKYQNIDSILIFAGEFILICIIPGHVLNYKGRKCSKN